MHSTTFYSLLMTLMLLIPVTSGVSASNDPFGKSASPSEFLPVEEAYQMDADLEGSTALNILWRIAPEYYLYKERFKLTASDNGKPLELPIKLEKGQLKYDEYFEKEVEVFYHSTEINAVLPKGVEAFDLAITSQGCADAGLCYPPQTQHFRVDTVKGTLTPQSSPTLPHQNNRQSDPAANTLAPSTTFLPYILLMAILGGLILNLMPCVFPVLSIKAISLAKASQSPHDQHLHGLTYTAGVILSFLTVACAMLLVRASGQAVGWGFQLQSPVFVSLLAYLFFIMGLGFSGLLNLGSGFMGLGQNLTGGGGLKSSFFTGVLAVIVASPCTAPMMGSALGYAMTEPAYISLSVFAALGFGMALPFLLISYLPNLANYLPAPGAWMDTLKQCMAFPLYLAAIWLLWVLGRQMGTDAVALLCSGALLIVFAVWLGQLNTTSSAGKTIKRATLVLSLVGASVIPLMSSQAPSPGGPWETYSEEKLAALRATGKPVFINLTAAWCITCLANEKIALSTQKVNDAITATGIHTLKGDWTNYNPEITALLNRYGRNGVPLYLVFPADINAKPEILPQLLTESMVINAIERATNRKTAQN